MTRKGQITIPVEIRRALGITEGDKVAVSLDERGEPHATIRPVRSVTDMTFGAVAARNGPEDFDELRHAFTEQAAERDERTRRSGR